MFGKGEVLGYCLWLVLEAFISDRVPSSWSFGSVKPIDGLAAIYTVKGVTRLNCLGLKATD